MASPSREPGVTTDLISFETPAARGTFRALRHRNYRLYAAGQIVSLVGTFMQSTALSWLVYRLTHSEILLGTTYFCSQFPVFALGPIGGIVSDRFSRYRIVILTQTLSLVQATLLAAITISGHVKVWEILCLATALGAINAFDMPARQSLIIELASREDLLSAIAINSAIFNSARVFGPSAGGFLVAFFSEGTCFAANAVSFLGVIACLAAMRLRPRPRAKSDESSWSHLKEGFRFAWEHRQYRLLFLMLAMMTTAGAPALVLMPFFAGDMFHRGSQGLGFLTGAMGAGAVIGTLVLARRTETQGLSRVVFYSAVVLGVSFAVFSYSPYFWLSMCIMPFIGFSVMRQMASANTLIQTFVPDHFRGRMMSLYAMTVVGLGPLGSLAAGALAHRYGPRFTVLMGGVLSLVAAVTVGLKLCKVDWAHA